MFVFLAVANWGGCSSLGAIVGWTVGGPMSNCASNFPLLAHDALVPVSCVLKQQWCTAGSTVACSKFAQGAPHEMASLLMTINAMHPKLTAWANSHMFVGTDGTF